MKKLMFLCLMVILFCWAFTSAAEEKTEIDPNKTLIGKWNLTKVEKKSGEVFEESTDLGIYHFIADGKYHFYGKKEPKKPKITGTWQIISKKYLKLRYYNKNQDNKSTCSISFESKEKFILSCKVGIKTFIRITDKNESEQLDKIINKLQPSIKD